jgi:hypothetical protein
MSVTLRIRPKGLLLVCASYRQHLRNFLGVREGPVTRVTSSNAVRLVILIA